MKPKKLLRELELVAEKLGIQTVYDTFQGRGGGCRVVKNRYIVINKRLPDATKAELFLRALSEMPIDEIFIKPEVRELLDNARAARSEQESDDINPENVNAEGTDHEEVDTEDNNPQPEAIE